MRHEEDVETLRSVVDRRTDALRVDRPAASELVVHLRLSDMMETAKKRRMPRLREVAIMYQRFVDRLEIESPRFDRATVVAALHFGANDKTGRFFATDSARRSSFELFDHVVSQLVERGLDVGVRSTSNVDSDFCFMANAHNFVPGQTGMSELVRLCLDRRAEVYDPVRIESTDVVIGRDTSWFQGPWLVHMNEGSRPRKRKVSPRR